MRRTDENFIDPEVEEMLEAIDATLAGEPVHPRHAEVAELALLLVADRPRPEPEFTRELDARVALRFADGAPSARSSTAPRRPWWRGWTVPLGAAAAVACGVIAAVVIASSGTPPAGSGTSSVAAAASSSASSSAASGAPSRLAGALKRSPGPTHKVSVFGTASSGAGSASGAGAASTGTASTPSATPPPNVANGSLSLAPAPVPNGRKQIQSAQLALNTPSDHVSDVAQEVFTVVHQVNGYVENSSVTQGSGGSAQFQLSIPTSSLQTAMSALSSLRYASVASRTDATQDVNGQYLSDVRALADARALRTSLLKALAAATTQAQIDSLQAQINDAEASIRSDESTLGNLNHQIDYSQVQVSINGALPVPVAHPGSGGFTIHRAVHDAGRVLVVLAGVGLIALAVLVPLGLVGLVVAAIVMALRRRWREQALDVAV